MTVLVTAASKHGSSFEIAEAIARVLNEHGVSADFVGIDEVSDLARYPESSTRAKRAVMRAVAPKEGDYRNWEEINGWAVEIAAQMR